MVVMFVYTYVHTCMYVCARLVGFILLVRVFVCVLCCLRPVDVTAGRCRTRGTGTRRGTWAR